jgi:hypothetical protein
MLVLATAHLGMLPCRPVMNGGLKCENSFEHVEGRDGDDRPLHLGPLARMHERRLHHRDSGVDCGPNSSGGCSQCERQLEARPVLIAHLVSVVPPLAGMGSPVQACPGPSLSFRCQYWYVELLFEEAVFFYRALVSAVVYIVLATENRHAPLGAVVSPLFPCSALK